MYFSMDRPAKIHNCHFDFFQVLVVTVNVPSTAQESTTAVFVMWDGEETSVIILGALVLDPTAQATESVIQSHTFAHVTKGGLARGVKSPTVQDPLTALHVDYATPL